MKGTIPRLRSLHQTLAIGSSKHEEMCHAEWDTVYFHNRRIKEAPSPDAQRAKNKFERRGRLPELVFFFGPAEVKGRFISRRL